MAVSRPIRLVIAVTDRNWFEHLRWRPHLTEVNFWSPSGSTFKALQPGELFLFKLHAPLNYLVGGGVFAHANVLPCSLAWEAFGEANGASSLMEMRTRMAKYRRADPTLRTDFPIGCRILTQPVFLEERDWIDVPASWSRNIVSFKTYSTDEPDGLSLWEALEGAFARRAGLELADEQARFGAPTLVRPRLGQGAFRLLVTDIYERRCAITNERTLPALDAAHMRPYGEGGDHAASNGLLLRRDIHSLFDAGYVTVTPEHRFEVSRRIREEFENGRHYYALHGAKVAQPSRPDWKPDPDALMWHNENRYLG